MKIKIIDLLNLVYNKKAPKKILYKYCEYEFNPEINDYQNKDGLELFSHLFTNEEQALFLEVEIIEEKPKEIDLIEFDYDHTIFESEFKNSTNLEEKLIERDDLLQEKINEIVNAFNYLLKKEDE